MEFDVIKIRATIAREYLTKRHRSARDEFYWTYTDDAPAWFREDFIPVAHGTDIFPDDHRFEFIVEALDVIADSDDEDDAREQMANGTTTSRHALSKWLASGNHRFEVVDEAVAGWGASRFPPEWSLADDLALGLLRERAQVLDQVLVALSAEDFGGV